MSSISSKSTTLTYRFEEPQHLLVEHLKDGWPRLHLKAVPSLLDLVARLLASPLSLGSWLEIDELILQAGSTGSSALSLLGGLINFRLDVAKISAILHCHFLEKDSE